MADEDIFTRISALVAEEDELRDRGDALEPSDRERIARIEVALDQCWDLLRQRRARREHREDPEDASVRDASTVEGYVQ